MNCYITGGVIRRLREARRLTQAQLAEQLCVSAKAVSKWETGRGLPDISLLEPLAKALGVSVTELLAGEPILNKNRGGNLLRSQLYVCPVCGNILHATGAAVVSCCGVSLPPLEAEEPDDAHRAHLERDSDGEYYLTVPHEMAKNHYISFAAYQTSDRFELLKLYPEGPCQARFFPRGGGVLYWYCNRHGLFQQKV